MQINDRTLCGNCGKKLIPWAFTYKAIKGTNTKTICCSCFLNIKYGEKK